jgi:hypothetical protein
MSPAAPSTCARRSGAPSVRSPAPLRRADLDDGTFVISNVPPGAHPARTHQRRRPGAAVAGAPARRLAFDTGIATPRRSQQVQVTGDLRTDVLSPERP